MKKNWICVLAALAVSTQVLVAAAAPKYVPGLSYGKEEGVSNICAIAIGRDDTLLMAADGKVRFFDQQSGQCTRRFPTGLTQADALATDGNTIYLLKAVKESKTVEVSGRKVKQEVPAGVLCKTFTWDGQPGADLKLADAKSATAAKVVGDKLYVADLASAVVRIYDRKTGAAVGTVGRNVRLCCGIFDFAVDPASGDVLIANLGAYKVQRYSADGKLKSEFGQRGTSDQDFQGCCNPVASVFLPGGYLVTAEKEPSRVKTYDAKGKLVQVFSNLEELVQGCQRVSVAVDSQGRVYLGVNAKARFVVQYVPQTS
jgi:hypothetical protein